MCCRPKASFLIDDILQDSPAKASDGDNARWPAVPTPVYLNQPPPSHHTPDMMTQAPTLPASRGAYVSEGLGTEDKIRMQEYSHQSHSQPLMDTLMTGAPYRGGFGRCWAVLPTYSLTVLARHPGHNKRKGGQVRFSAQQTSNLERRFRAHKYLSPEERRHFAAQLKLTDRQVKTWFQNRRAKWRRINTSTSTTDGSQSDDTTSCNASTDEDVFDSSLSPINILI